MRSAPTSGCTNTLLVTAMIAEHSSKHSCDARILERVQSRSMRSAPTSGCTNTLLVTAMIAEHSSKHSCDARILERVQSRSLSARVGRWLGQ